MQMNFNKRIDSFLMSPMMVDPTWGLSVFMQYCDELQLASSEGGTLLLRDEWTRKKEQEQSTFFECNDSFIKPMGMDQAMETTSSIAVIQLRGAMRANGGLSSQGIDKTINELRQVSSSKVMGAVLKTSCGGGEVEAAQRLYSAIKEFANVKPIVQLVDGLSASGAVFSGVACDEIMMNGTTAETGSIGVVAQFDKAMIEDIKENVLSVYASQSSDKHSMFKNLMAGDIAAVQSEYLNPVAIEFQKLVQRERKGVDISALTGKMYLTKEAIKLGLADRKGTMNDALNRVRILSRNRNRNSNTRKAVSSLSF